MTRFLWLWLCLGALWGIGCTSQNPEPERASSPASAQSEPLFSLLDGFYPPWTLNGNVVPVCWESSGYEFQKEVIEDAIAREWSKNAGIEFQWTAACPTSGSAKHVRINIAAAGPTEEGVTNSYYGSPGIGMRAFHTAADGTSIQLWLKAPGAGNTVRWEYLGVHEMGHVLGYQHEMDRPDNTTNQCGTMGSWSGTTTGDFDPTSIMSYCNLTPFLSETDKTGSMMIYGPPKGGTETQFLAADFTNDGRADVVQTYRQWGSMPLCVTNLSSGFTCSNPVAGIANSNSPQQRFLAGDFNGDSYQDVAQVYRGWTSIPLCRGGSGGTWTCDNLSASFTNSGNAEQEFLAADYDADGKTDVIQTARGQASMPVCSYGSGAWSCTSHAATAWDSGDPSQRFLVARFNSDSRADVIQVFRGWSYIPVCTSTTSGWSCSNPSATIYNSGSAEQQFLTGDFDGDGLTDVFQTWRGWASIPVCKSTGTGWSCSNPSASVWNAHHPDQKFLTGDFNGDGKTDIAQTFRGWDSIPVCLSTGTGWSCSNWGATVRNTNREQKFIAADFDGDGKTDIIQTYRGWRSYIVCLSTGSGWNCSTRPATIYNWD